MELNLKRLAESFSAAQAEETVPKGDTNPYLLATIIEPLLARRSVKYGDIDFSEFELDDLRRAAGYCDDISRTSYKLETLVSNMSASEAAACKTRSFC